MTDERKTDRRITLAKVSEGLFSSKKRKMARMENLRQGFGWLWHEPMNYAPDFLDQVI
jgi:hypothetical protein